MVCCVCVIVLGSIFNVVLILVLILVCFSERCNDLWVLVVLMFIVINICEGCVIFVV